jgi:hypothetical protein
MSLRQPIIGRSVAWRVAAEIFLAVVAFAVLLVLACTVTVGVVLSHG